MEYNQKLYTKEKDGTIQKWYVAAWVGPNIAVSTVRNPKLHDYHKYFHMDEVGKKIFLTRKEALQAEA